MRRTMLPVSQRACPCSVVAFAGVIAGAVDFDHAPDRLLHVKKAVLIDEAMGFPINQDSVDVGAVPNIGGVNDAG